MNLKIKIGLSLVAFAVLLSLFMVGLLNHISIVKK